MIATHRPLLAESRRLIALAWPVALTQLQWIALNVIDVIMVGHSSTAELGFFSAGRMATWVVMIAGFGALTGVTVFTARADGAGERAQVGKVFRQGVLYALALGFGAAIPTIVLADAIMAVAGVPDELAGGGATVLRLMAIGYPANFLLVAASFWLEGLSRPRVAMLVSFFTLPLNIALNGLFVFGYLGVPKLGAAGAALGTTITFFVSSAILIAYVHRMPDARALGIGRGWRRAWREGGALRRFGWAPAVASAMENGGFAVLIALSTRLGAAVAGAFQAMLSAHVLAIALSFGFASAAAVRVGNAVGAKEPAAIRSRGLLAAGLAVLTTLPWAAAYLAVPHLLAGPSSPDPAVISATVAMLGVMAFFIWADAVQITMIFSLRAAGDQVAAGVIQASSYFGVMSLAGWLLVGPTGAPGLALAMGLGLATAAVAGALRFGWITRTGRRPALPR